MAYLSLRGVAAMVKTMEVFDRALFVQFASSGSTSLMIFTLVSVPPSRSASLLILTLVSVPPSRSTSLLILTLVSVQPPCYRSST